MIQAKGCNVIVCKRPILDKYNLSNIIFDDNIDERDYFEGFVMSVGNDLEDMKLQVGDLVLVRNVEDKIKLGTNKPGIVYLISGYDILCTFEEEEAK